eukprot:scaffold3194_cov191-Alexandrium_tamarense.AAC.4
MELWPEEVALGLWVGRCGVLLCGSTGTAAPAPAIVIVRHSNKRTLHNQFCCVVLELSDKEVGRFGAYASISFAIVTLLQIHPVAQNLGSPPSKNSATNVPTLVVTTWNTSSNDRYSSIGSLNFQSFRTESPTRTTVPGASFSRAVGSPQLFSG